MPCADDLRVYAAVAQKERDLTSERSWAALAAAKARGMILGGDREYRPPVGAGTAAAVLARRERGVPTPSGLGAWTQTKVARVLARAAPDQDTLVHGRKRDSSPHQPA